MSRSQQLRIYVALLALSLANAADFTLAPSTLSLSLLPDQTVTTSFVIHNNTAQTGSYSYSIAGLAVSPINWQATGLWHRSTIADSDGDGSCWYYGREDTHTYDTGTTNSGTLTSPPFQVLQYGAPLTYNFQLQMDAYYDEARVEVSSDGFATATTLIELFSGVPGGWVTNLWNLTQWYGKIVQVRFVFDTHNALSNDFLGLLVDNIQISGVPIPSWIQPVNITSGQVFPGFNSPALQLQVSAAGLAPGTYSAVINVVGGAGSSATYSLPVTLTVASANQPPVAVIMTSTDHGSAPLAIHFDASSSTDPDGSVVGYAWTFGDGTTASTAVADHTYTATGSYTATLVVTDNLGATNTATRTITVTRPPVANAVITPVSGVAPLVISADGSGSVGVDGAITTYAWSFGDGSTATGPTASHTFTDPGTYTVTLTVTDTAGGSSSMQDAVTVLRPNLPPTASAIATPTAGNAPLTVAFDGSGSADPDGTIASYAWSFGDCATATGPTPTHVYTQAGAFNAMLTVSDDGGATASATVTVTVGSRPSPPTNVHVASRSRTMAQIAWSPPSTGAASYAILRDSVPIAFSIAPSWIDTDATDAHVYSIEAADLSGRLSDPSDSVQTTVTAMRTYVDSVDGLTGDKSTLLAKDTNGWFTTAAAITVNVHYDVSPAVAEFVQVTLSDGSSVRVAAQGGSGTCSVPVPLGLEGSFLVFVSVEAFKQGAPYRVDSPDRNQITVRRSPPSFSTITDPTLWDGGARQAVSPLDANPVTLNGNAEAGPSGNQSFRAHVRPLTYSASAFSAWALPHLDDDLSEGSVSARLVPINGAETPLAVTEDLVDGTTGYHITGFGSADVADGVTGSVFLHAVDRCGNVADVPLFNVVKRMTKVQPAFIPGLEADETSTTRMLALTDVTFTAVSAVQDVPGGGTLSGIRTGWRLAAPIEMDRTLVDTDHAGSTTMSIQDSYGNVSDMTPVNVYVNQAAIVATDDSQGFIHYPLVNVIESNTSGGGFFGGYLNTGYMGLQHDFGALLYTHGPGLYADEAIPEINGSLFDGNGEAFPPLLSNIGGPIGYVTNVISLDDTLADGSPHCLPRCIANAASWEDQPRIVGVSLRSETIGQLHDLYVSIGTGMQPRWLSVRGLAAVPATAGDRPDTMAGTLTLDRDHRFTWSGWQPPLFGCDLPVDNSGPPASFFGEVSGRGFDIITMTSDVAGVGSHRTLTVEGAFVDDPSQFDAAATTVEFTDPSGAVVSTRVSAGGTDDPGLITIHALRLRTLAPTTLTSQRLEIDCVIGTQVQAGAYGLRLRCGVVGSDGNAFEMPRCLAIIDGALLEYPLDAVASDPLAAPLSAASRHHFVRWRPVSPALVLHNENISLDAQSLTLHVAGRVRSPVDVLEGYRNRDATALWSVEIDGMPLSTVGPDGEFTADVPLLQQAQHVSVTALDAMGAWANATIFVDDDQVTVGPVWDQQPAFHRLDLGDAGGVAAQALQGRALVLQIVGPAGKVLDQMPIQTVIEDGRVLSDPFLVAAPGQQSGDAMALPSNAELVMPSLDDDLVLTVDGAEVLRLEGAGFVPQRLDEQRVVYDDKAIDPDGGLPTIQRPLAFHARNIAGTPTLTDTAGFTWDALTTVDQAFTSWAQRSAVTHAQQAKATVTLATAVNTLRISAQDPDGQEVGPLHDEQLYVLNPQAIKTVDKAETDVSHQVFYVELDPQYVDTPPSRQPVKAQDRVAALNALCKRYDLRVVGHESYGDGRAKTLRIWYKLNGNYNPAEVIGALRELGALASSYRDDAHVVDTLRNLDTYSPVPPWQAAKGLHVTEVRARDQAVREALRAMNDNQAACLNSALNGSTDNNLYIADARAVDPGSTFQTSGISLAFAVRRPFDLLRANRPSYQTADDIGPTYVLRKRTIRGIDQARTSGATFPSNVAGASPRVRVSDPGVPASLSDIIGPQTNGVIIVIHGYNVDSNPDADYDERDPGQGGTAGFYDGTLRCYWPQFQWMMRDPSLGKVPWDPATLSGYAIIHVAWVGNYKPPGGVLSALFLNVDEPLAHDAGERVVSRLIQDIDNQARTVGIDKSQFGIVIAAESLGNRCAVSTFNALRQSFLTDPVSPIDAKVPRLRYISIHPALRHSDISNQWIGDGYGVATRLVGDEGELPQSAMQNELSATTSYRAPSDPFGDLLMFYSPFDKAGQIFETGVNNAAERKRLTFDLRHASMLGRVGVGGDTFTGTTPTGYNLSTALVQIHAVHSLAGTIDEDLWHVSLFGWILPGMQTRSRPTYEWNTEDGIVGRAIGILETDENIQTTTLGQLQPIWQQMGQLIQGTP